MNEWISVKDRRPTKEDANLKGFVIAIDRFDKYPRSWWYELIVNYPEDYLFWMPFPKPPKVSDLNG